MIRRGKGEVWNNSKINAITFPFDFINVMDVVHETALYTKQCFTNSQTSSHWSHIEPVFALLPHM